MTVAELIQQLQTFSPDMRVTLRDPDTGWFLKVQLKHVSADDTSFDSEFVAITSDYGERED